MPPTSRSAARRRPAPSAPFRDAPRPQGRESHSPSFQPWRGVQPLLPALSSEARQLLNALAQALPAVRPLKAAHRKSLPRDIADLSRLLTVDRAELHHPYWGSPGLASAYMHYFLPWNIIRLARLLSALPLPDPQLWLQRHNTPWLLDVGSGPLTLPLALWLARPEWRSLPLGILALDTAALPLELGRELLKTWAGMSGQPLAWRILTARAPLEHLPRHAARLLRERSERDTPAVWLVSAANVLNELYGKTSDHEAAATDPDAAVEDEETGTTGGRLPGVLDALAPLLWEGPDGEGAPAPAALFVEPGTRLGGKTIMRLRTLALDGGLSALVPCTHDEACPLLADRRRGWCHFTFDSNDAPAWLTQLSRQAGLAKTSLSLAPLLLTPRAQTPPHHEDAIRILSAPFRVPGMRGEARYACAARGLLLLEQAEGVPSGGLLHHRIPEDAGTDSKSGALIMAAPGMRAAHSERPPRRSSGTPAPRAPQPEQAEDASAPASDRTRPQRRASAARRVPARKGRSSFQKPH